MNVPGFEDKTVVTVGIGNSGVDVAVELSRVAKQVYLSTRRGAWLLNKIADYGLPFDMFLNSRIFRALNKVGRFERQSLSCHTPRRESNKS